METIKSPSNPPIGMDYNSLMRFLGGQAFPAFSVVDGSGQGGMTLRDYMAAKAMQGMLACKSDGDGLELAEFAYRCADAMLIVRAR